MMKWQLTSIIICLSFPKALTVRCYECISDCDTNQNTTTICSNGCVSSRSVSVDAGIFTDFALKTCIGSVICESVSLNLGFTKMVAVNKCCHTDLCNSGPIPAVDLRPNGKQCYFCVGENCLGNVHCEGIEDHCIDVREFKEGVELHFKGCASKRLCELPPSVIFTNATWKCCNGNLCNSTESVTPSFLLMLLFLLSSFLLH